MKEERGPTVGNGTIEERQVAGIGVKSLVIGKALKASNDWSWVHATGISNGLDKVLILGAAPAQPAHLWLC